MALPVSHTCFFQLDLPSYSTEAVRGHAALSFVYLCLFLFN